MGICLNTYNSSNCRESIVVDNFKGCNNQDQSNTQTKDPSEISELFFHRVSTFKIKQGQLIRNKSLSTDSIVNIEKTEEKCDEKPVPFQPLLYQNTRKVFSDSNIPLSNHSVSNYLEIDMINIVLLGGKGVGKSSFLIKLTKNYFEKYYIPTIYCERKVKKISFKDKKYTFNFIIPPINDSDHVYDNIFEKAHFIFLFYDISVKGSFDQTKKILFNQVNSYAKIFKNKITNFYFIGNKVDIPTRGDPKEKIEAFCNRHNFDFFEISVKTGNGVLSLMNTIVSKYEEIIS